MARGGGSTRGLVRWNSEYLDSGLESPSKPDPPSIHPQTFRSTYHFDHRKVSHVWAGTTSWLSEEVDSGFQDPAQIRPGEIDVSRPLQIPDITREVQRFNLLQDAADAAVREALIRYTNIHMRRLGAISLAGRWARALRAIPTLANAALLFVDFIETYTWADHHVEKNTGYHLHEWLAASAWYGASASTARDRGSLDWAFRAWLSTLDPVPASAQFLGALIAASRLTWEVLEPEFEYNGDWRDLGIDIAYNALGEGETRGLRQGGQQ